MNTEKSDQIVKTWNKKDNPLQRACVTFERTFKTTPEILFLLLCPTTEYDWLPGWNCELLHSESGYTENNVIFRSSFFGADELFVCTRFEPNQAIDYARSCQDLCNKLDIRVTDNCDGTVTGRWIITVSALNKNGNQMVTEMKFGAQAMMDPILDALEHYINTGQIAA